MALILTIAGVAAAGYAGVVGLLYAGQRSLLFLPDDGRPSVHASGVPEMREVRLATADGLELTGWYAEAAPGRPTVVYLHGNGGHIGYRGSRVRPYLDAGLGVLLVGYRGYGGNPGRPSEDGLSRDARAGLDFVLGRGVPAAEIVLYGESLGTAVAVRTAAEMAAAGTPVGALVLEAPMSSIVDVAAHHYPWAPVRWLMKDRFEAAGHIAAVATPVLVVHGEADAVVPVRFGRALFEAARDPKRALWVEGGGHEDLHAFGLGEAVLRFVGETVGGR
jgi:hypothetical protein